MEPETISKEEITETKIKEEKKPVKKMKKKRTVDLESFSRARLREKKEVVMPGTKEIKER